MTAHFLDIWVNFYVIAYVYVFMVNLKSKEFGLIVPPNMNESKRIEQIISEVINQYLKRNLIKN